MACWPRESKRPSEACCGDVWLVASLECLRYIALILASEGGGAWHGLLVICALAPCLRPYVRR
eukprot:365272-Chlamydomonas_euryale.AAC.18